MFVTFFQELKQAGVPVIAQYRQIYFAEKRAGISFGSSVNKNLLLGKKIIDQIAPDIIIVKNWPLEILVFKKVSCVNGIPCQSYPQFFVIG